jgi:ATP-dependent Clp protease protease subunit
MSKRTLPQAEIVTRPGMRSELMPSALRHWNPDVQAATEGEHIIPILDVIGSDWMGEGVTAKRISATLRAIGAKDVVVTINSPGGDYFEGLAIYNVLREHPAKVTVKVLGIAASAASVIAMAGDDIQIARAGFMMIHNTWVVAVGDRNVMREIAEWLEPFDRTAVDIFSARSGLEPKEIGKMLDRETWINGSDAVEQGFADSLLPSDEVTTKTNNSTEAKPVAAARKVDTLLARMNVPRQERRELLRALKGDTPRAVHHDTQTAVVVNEALKILAFARSL